MLIVWLLVCYRNGKITKNGKYIFHIGVIDINELRDQPNSTRRKRCIDVRYPIRQNDLELALDPSSEVDMNVKVACSSDSTSSYYYISHHLAIKSH